MLIREYLLLSENLSANEKAAAAYLAGHSDEIAHLSITDIASASFVSASTVVRLSSKLGYSGYKELKQAMIEENKYLNAYFTDVDPNMPFRKEDSLKRISEKISSLLQDSIADTCSLIDEKQLSIATGYLCKARTINVFGITFAIETAYDFRLKMMSIGKNVSIISNPEEFIFTLQSADEGTCSIMISYSGETKELIDAAAYCRMKGFPVIAITSIGNNTLSNTCDCVLPLTTREKISTKIANYTSNIAIHYILDVLYSTVFASDYRKNLNAKLQLSNIIDAGRTSSVSLIREDDTEKTPD